MRTKAALHVVYLLSACGLAGAEDSPTIIPPLAVTGNRLAPQSHPLHAKINAFLTHQASVGSFQPTGLGRKDYLDVIRRQVRAMQRYQNGEGRIIDPVEHVEKFYATPCYAHCVAVLAASRHNTSRHNTDTELLNSGIKAMDVAISDMARGTAPGGHGDFYTYPVMLAFELFGKVAPPKSIAAWREMLGRIDPKKLYRGGPGSANWNVVNLSGEYLRARRHLTDMGYVETCLAAQLKHFTPLGMYQEHGHPLPYDHFPRHYLAGVLHGNYRGESYAAYRDLLWKGAWTSLLMQSRK